jgi:hypothetical protein
VVPNPERVQYLAMVGGKEEKGKGTRKFAAKDLRNATLEQALSAVDFGEVQPSLLDIPVSRTGRRKQSGRVTVSSPLQPPPVTATQEKQKPSRPRPQLAGWWCPPANEAAWR